MKKMIKHVLKWVFPSKKEKRNNIQIEEQVGSFKLTSSIFHWNTSNNEPIHALLRVYNNVDEKICVIFISDLKSNVEGVSILHNFGNLVSKIERDYQVRENSDFLVTWYIHRGGFSSHEGVPGEILLKVNLEKYYEIPGVPKQPETVLIEEHDMEKELKDIKLEPMRNILKKLDWELIDYFNDPEW